MRKCCLKASHACFQCRQLGCFGFNQPQCEGCHVELYDRDTVSSLRCCCSIAGNHCCKALSSCNKTAMFWSFTTALACRKPGHFVLQRPPTHETKFSMELLFAKNADSEKPESVQLHPCRRFGLVNGARGPILVGLIYLPNIPDHLKPWWMRQCQKNPFLPNQRWPLSPF